MFSIKSVNRSLLVKASDRGRALHGCLQVVSIRREAMLGSDHAAADLAGSLSVQRKGSTMVPIAF